MIEALVAKIQEGVDEMESPTAQQVVEVMRTQKIVVHNVDDVSDALPVIGSKFFIEDTVRTKTSPDGHFQAHYLTAYPYTEAGARKWRVRAGRPNDDLELSA